MPNENFTGFPRDLPQFLDDLAVENSREWYKSERKRYEQSVLEPAKAFVSAMAPALDGISPLYNAEPRINASISRLERDTRFSPDKRPYNPRLHFVFWRGADKKSHQGLHFVIHPDAIGIGAGLWQYSPSQLKAFRVAIADEEAVAELDQLIVDIENAGGGALDEPALKRPTVEGSERTQFHSRFKGIVVRTETALDDAMFSPDAVAFAINKLKVYEPLMAWLDRHVVHPAL